MKLGKAAGHDGIKPEMIKYMGVNGIKVLNKIFNLSWEQGIIPNDWEVAIILPIYKKGDNRMCENYRGISLLCVAAKLYEGILEERLRRIIDSTLEQTQSGFRKGFSVQDHIFTTRQIIEKQKERNRPSYLCFVDLEKAFDRAPREQIWKILKARNVKTNLLQAIQSIYNKTINYVRTGNMKSDEFNTVEGLRQGGVLSPILFVLLIDEVIKETRTKTKTLKVGYRHMQPTEITECAFADDLILFASNEKDLQHNLNIWKAALENKNMKINVTKTKVMTLGRTEEQIKINIDGKK